MTLETARRALIASVPAVALAATIPASAMSAPADRRQWEFAMARYAQADAAYEAYKRGTYDPAQETEQAFEKAHGVVHELPNYFEKRRDLWATHGTAHRVPDHVDERLDALCSHCSDLQDAVMQTPAPDLAALRWKLDRLLVDDCTECTSAWSYNYVAQALADMARLLPEGR